MTIRCTRYTLTFVECVVCVFEAGWIKFVAVARLEVIILRYWCSDVFS